MEWSEADAARLEKPERRALLDPERILPLLGPLRGLRIADVGAGSGMHAFPLARAVGPGGRAYAVDVSESLVRMLGKRKEAAGATSLEPVLSTPEHIPLPDGGVDAVLSISCFHDYEEETLPEIARIIALKGLLLVVDWDPAAAEKSAGPPLAVRKGPEEVAAACAAQGLAREAEGRLDGQIYWIRFRKDHAC